MSDPEREHVVCLVRLNEDGTINDSYLSAAAPSLPRISRGAPLDEEEARSLLSSMAGAIERFCGHLRTVADVMPVSEHQGAMLDDSIPLDAVTNMQTAIVPVVREYLRPAAEALRRVSTLTDDDLRRDFEERHARKAT